MTLSTGDLIIFAILIVLAAVVICVKLYTRKRLKNIDGFSGVMDSKDKNVISVFGDEKK